MTGLKVPFFVISYGDFAKTKKLFYFERDGKSQWPVFSDAIKADDFVSKMRNVLDAAGDSRTLAIQCCSDTQKAIDMLTVIMTYIIELKHVTIDCEMSTDDLVVDIDAFLQMLQKSVGSNDEKSSSDS